MTTAAVSSTNAGGRASAARARPGAVRSREEQLRKLRKFSQDMEALFLQTMLKVMRQSVPDNPLVGGSFAEKTYQSMADEETARNVAESGGFGLGRAIFLQLSRNLAGGGAATLESAERRDAAPAAAAAGRAYARAIGGGAP